MNRLQKTVIVILMLVFASIALADIQAKRKALIQNLINGGIFQKVEVPGSLPHLWVNPVFYALNLEDKNLSVSVVYYYYTTISSSYKMVVLYDSHSGKKVGVYGAVYGGLKMY